MSAQAERSRITRKQKGEESKNANRLSLPHRHIVELGDFGNIGGIVDIDEVAT